MTIAIIGTGYVGLTTGVCLADLGHTVICVDNNQEKLAKLVQGISPIYEPDLENLLKKNITEGRLSFTEDIANSVQSSEAIFICVNTPPKHDGQADLKFVEGVARQIAGCLNGGYKVIVDKSTVPVKTAEKVKETIEKYAADNTNFDVISNPEFLREGRAVYDTLNPDRLVIGSDSMRGTEVMLKLYKPLIDKTKVPVKIVSVRSAELIKHGANTFLAAKISFANLIAQTCEEAGADALEVLEAIGLDERIGSQFLQPGLGFGGSCFPKDIAAYKKTLEILGIENDFVSAVEKINTSALDRFIKKIERELWVLDGKKIAVLGLAFKANTDDIRNSPAIKLISRLISDGATVTAYDPQAMENSKKQLPEIIYAKNAYDAVKDAEAVIIATEWQEFKNLELQKLKNLMETAVIFDGRNIFDPQQVKKEGFKYFGVGR